MSVPSYTGAIDLDLSPGEAWLVHHVMLDALGLAGPDADPVDEPAWPVVSVVEKLEAGRRRFTAFELDYVRYACGSYANGSEVPEADRIHARLVVDRVDVALEGASRGARV